MNKPSIGDVFIKRAPLHGQRFDRDRIDPVAYMRSIGWPTEHITYDPKMRKGDFYIGRQSSHDGTLTFEKELLRETLVNLANRIACHVSQQGLVLRREQITYVVGPLKLSSVYGTVDLPAGHYPGMRQRTHMPVKAVIQPSTVSGEA